MRVIYVGTSFFGGTCLQRMQGMKDLGHEVTLVDTQPVSVRKTEKQIFYRIKRKIFGPTDLAGINQQIIRLIEKDTYDILWADKGLTVKPDTLRCIKKISPKIVTVSYSPDDMLNPDNISKQYIECVGLYDVHVTANSHNVEEIKGWGANDVYFLGRGFCPHTHRPVVVPDPEKEALGGPVGFIGHFEKERADSITFLAKNGIRIKIWGNWPNDWAKKMGLKTVEVMGKRLWREDLVRGICSFDINLNFLRKANRDQQTTRSVAIPACRRFMLAERSQEHLSMFREGIEAEFFETNEELLRKVQYYLEHKEERRTIAEAGYKRCMKSGYSNQERLKHMFRTIFPGGDRY
ncbi:MAG: glycosyltransferase [Candidatus Omnitrophica bacterium]|nr:glycosyltransferase [Candidatus Omnitrophota bacterium]